MPESTGSTSQDALLREWAADLAATESWLRALAAGTLSYAACMRMERRANAISARLLERIGQGREVERRETPSGLGRYTHASAEPTDELLHAVRSGDQPARYDSQDDAVTAIPEPDDEPITAYPEPHQPAAAPAAATASWITYDEPEEQPAYIEYEDDGKTDEVGWSEPATDPASGGSAAPRGDGAASEVRVLAERPVSHGGAAQAAAATPSEWDSLVSFEEEEEPTNPGVMRPHERAMSLRDLAPTVDNDDDDMVVLTDLSDAIEEDEEAQDGSSTGDPPSYLTFDGAPAEDDEVTGVFDGRRRTTSSPQLGQPDTGEFADADVPITLDEPISLQSDLDGVEEEPPVPQPSIGGDSNTAPVVRKPASRTPASRGRAVTSGDAFDLVADFESEDGEVDDGYAPSGGVGASRPAPVAAAHLPTVHASSDDVEAVDFGDDIVGDDTSPEPVAPRAAQPRPVAVAVPAQGRGAAAVAATALGARVTAGLYGGAAVPTIRDTSDPRPKAAAIQLNAQQGTSRVLGLEEEEEPLEIGSAEDYGEEEPDYDPATGFGVAIQEYEDVAEEEPEPEPEPERAPPPPSGPTAAEVGELLRKARSADEAGQLDEGIALYSDVIDADPDHMEARVGRGRLFLDRGDFARSMSDFMVAEEVAPNHPEPQIAIGDLHFARKDYRKAIDFFDLALSMDDKSSKAYCRRGISHYYRKNYPAALKDLTQAQKLDAGTPNITTYISMVKKKMK